MLSFGLALSAGFCAALASLCVKLAFSEEEILERALCRPFWEHQNAGYCGQGVFLSRIMLFALMFLFNGLMWTLFVKSMRMSSSAQAMMTNSASNFIFSALFGKFVFGEILSLRWWMGASLITLGIYLMNKNVKTSNITCESSEGRSGKTKAEKQS